MAAARSKRKQFGMSSGFWRKGLLGINVNITFFIFSSGRGLTFFKPMRAGAGGE